MQRGKMGILAIWHDLAIGREDEMLDWYDREHHPERLSVPGFLSARRYEALDEGVERLFIRYEVDSPGVLASEEYLQRVNNPTPWSLLCQPLIRNNSRTVCRRVANFGWAGGYVAAIRFTHGSPALDLAQVEHASMAASGICGVEYWVADSAATAIKTDEKRLRGKDDRTIDAALVVHATRLHKLRDFTAAWLDNPPWSSTEKPRAAHFSLSFECTQSFL
ncbi:MAG: hypothetical protein JWQ22_625 [Devosia sp.]|nr:hypothetical protein [Devosia sp.]